MCESEHSDLHIQTAHCGVDHWMCAGQFARVWHWSGKMATEKQIIGKQPKERKREGEKLAGR